MRITLVTDSTSDLPQDLRGRLGVRVVPLYVNLSGAIYRDWEEITPTEIFQKVREGAAFPTTSQPSPEDFARVYREALEEADHVLSLHISGKLSGTVQSAELAAQEFPGRVTVVDTQAASLGVGMMVLRAKELLEEGQSLEAVLAELERLLQAIDEAPREDYPEQMRRDLEFHRALVRLSGNRTLYRLYEDLLATLALARSALPTLSQDEATRREHRAILEALLRRDPEEARRAVEAHVFRFRDLVVGRLREEGG